MTIEFDQKPLTRLALAGRASLQRALGTSPQTPVITKRFPKARLWFQPNRLPSLAERRIGQRGQPLQAAFERGVLQ